MCVKRENIFSKISSSNYKEKYKEWKSSVCHGNHPFEEVNDNKDFEASKLGGTIEWE